MTLFQTSGALLSLVALLGWLNHRYIKLPAAIGLTLAGLSFSLVAVALGQVNPGVLSGLQSLISGIDFN